MYDSVILHNGTHIAHLASNTFIMWKNLNEERPTKGQKVLICYQAFGEYEYAIAEYIGYEEYFTTIEGRVLFSTHWMPLMPPN